DTTASTLCSSISYSSYHSILLFYFFFFFTGTATTEIYTLSLHDALPISGKIVGFGGRVLDQRLPKYLNSSETPLFHKGATLNGRSEEHTSELQSRGHLVCRLLLEKKKKT